MAPLFFSVVCSKEAFHRVRGQDVTEFDSDGCSVFFLLGEKKKEREREKEKKREREMTRGLFFPRAGHTFLAACRIFAAVRCN
jgi:hypothetical protein